MPDDVSAPSFADRVERMLAKDYPEFPYPDILAKRIAHMLPMEDPTPALAQQQRRIEGQSRELDHQRDVLTAWKQRGKALVKLLYPDEMTPTAKRQLEDWLSTTSTTAKFGG